LSSRGGARALAPLLTLLAAIACSPQPSRSRAAPSIDAVDGAPPLEVRATSAEAGLAAVVDAGEAAPPEVPEPTFDELLVVLFAERTSSAPIVAACPVTLPLDARVRCLFDERYRSDTKAAALAHELWVKWRIMAGVEVAHTMDGGYRGMIRIEPAVPVGAERKHLEWVSGAFRDFDAFFAELEARRNGTAADASRASVAKPYRWRPLTLRFMRSVAPARTPAAYAHDWTVAYNFVGTLNVSADAVRETMFHEIFHLNDAVHGNWSPRALGAIFDAVVKKCGVSIPCLTPYTPNETLVRSGTYYAFQPGNGVMEYAAELALRYYREQRAALRGGLKAKAWKCGPPENAQAWALIKDEFFGGVDATPACP
jgi:hypothetical protein